MAWLGAVTVWGPRVVMAVRETLQGVRVVVVVKGTAVGEVGAVAEELLGCSMVQAWNMTESMETVVGRIVDVMQTDGCMGIVWLEDMCMAAVVFVEPTGQLLQNHRSSFLGSLERHKWEHWEDCWCSCC